MEGTRIVLIGEEGQQFEFDSIKATMRFTGRSNGYISSHATKDRVIEATDGKKYKIARFLDGQDYKSDQCVTCKTSLKLCKHLLVGKRKVQKCDITNGKAIESGTCPMGELADYHMFYTSGNCYMYPTGEVFRAEVMSEGEVMGAFITDSGIMVRHVIHTAINVTPVTYEMYIDMVADLVDRQKKDIKKHLTAYK